MNKTEILVNKPIYLGFLILELSKMLMYEFWYYYVKPKYDEKAKLCYTNTYSFILCIKTVIESNWKVIGLMKDELGRNVMTKFVRLTEKTYSYLIEDGGDDKKAKDTKMCVVKDNLSLHRQLFRSNST